MDPPYDFTPKEFIDIDVDWPLSVEIENSDIMTQVKKTNQIKTIDKIGKAAARGYSPIDSDKIIHEKYKDIKSISDATPKENSSFLHYPSVIVDICDVPKGLALAATVSLLRPKERTSLTRILEEYHPPTFPLFSQQPFDFETCLPGIIYKYINSNGNNLYSTQIAEDNKLSKPIQTPFALVKYKNPDFTQIKYRVFTLNGTYIPEYVLGDDELLANTTNSINQVNRSFTIKWILFGDSLYLLEENQNEINYYEIQKIPTEKKNDSDFQISSKKSKSKNDDDYAYAFYFVDNKEALTPDDIKKYYSESQNAY